MKQVVQTIVAIVITKILPIVVMLLLVSCQKLPAQKDKETVFTIKKGEHYSDAKHKVVQNKLKYSVYFDESAIYTIDSVNQHDINKLFGFNSCYAAHDYQSARFGWNWVNDSLKIWYYVYDKGKRQYGYIASIKILEWNTFELIQTGSTYTFKVNDKNFVYKKDWNCNAQFNYHLWPYFGGNIPAPHEVKIKFKELK